MPLIDQPSHGTPKYLQPKFGKAKICLALIAGLSRLTLIKDELRTLEHLFWLDVILYALI